MRRWLLAFLLLTGCAREVRDPLPGYPKLFLWAWERPENLLFISPKTTGVAYLADTITLTGEAMSYRPRLQPLRVPPDTRLIAVVRIESHGPHHVAVGAVAEEVLRATGRPEVSAIQIDYDAQVSERPFYRDLLFELKRRSTLPLEMTALVSWCRSDSWLRELPVVDAVPMFFRMGADPHSATERLDESLCQSSIGISTDESYTRISKGGRVFVFHPRSWTEADYRAVLRESAKWQ